MSYRQEEKELAAINLLIKIIDEQSELKKIVSKLGAELTSTQMVGHIERIVAIIVTSGAPEENKKLRNALKLLNLELIDEFPSQEMIEFLLHDVLNKYYDAVGEHFLSWEESKKQVVLGAFGNYEVIEPKLFGGLPKRKRTKKLTKMRRLEDELEEDYDDL